ncbi:right-handed parallel beta-helix repeat-containing protein, partial [Clostridium gasigenes]|uniref:right-handed parallel beta-helix repeat-containing protein n=1 Tax=Clostridium gasigenes TaxID=94869 RepID=UPI001C0D1140
MKLKKLGLISISIFITFIFQILFSYYVLADNSIPSDPDWTIVDELTPNSKTSLNTVINNLIANKKTKIYIKDGVYNLNGNILIDQPNIIIQGQSKEKTKIKQTDAGSNSIEVRNTNFVIVSDLNIDNINGKISFLCQNSNNIQLKNCIIYGSSDSNAVAFFGKQCADDMYAVENNDLDDANIFDGNTVYSYLPDANVKDGIMFSKQKNGIVKNNTILGSRIAFYLSRNSELSYNTIKDSQTNGIRYTVPAYDNKIVFNFIENTKASAITVDRDSKGITPREYRSTGLEISNNTISNSRYFGIEISNLKSSTIKNNILNKIDFSGIYLLYCDYLDVKENKIDNCGLVKKNGNLWGWNENLNSGIFIDYMVTYSNIYSNQITNLNNLNPDCSFGVRIQADETNHYNNVTYNTINGYFEYGTSIRTGDPVYNIDLFNTINLKLRAVPTNIKTMSTLNDITVSWDSVTGVFGYYIEVDGVEINNGNNTSYVHPGLSSGTSHKYRVRVKGGQWSDIVNATALAPTVATSIEASDISITENKISNVDSVVKDQFKNVFNGGYTLRYSVGDSNIAEVDANGKVTAKAYVKGTNTTTLTISIEGTTMSKTINITVNKEIIIPPPTVATSIEASDISITENKISNVDSVVKDQFKNVFNG